MQWYWILHLHLTFGHISMDMTFQSLAGVGTMLPPVCTYAARYTEGDCQQFMDLLPSPLQTGGARKSAHNWREESQVAGGVRLHTTEWDYIIPMG